MPSKFNTRVVIAFTAVYTIWGSTYLAIRFTVETIPPLLSAGLRFLIAGLLMYLYSRFKQKQPRPGKQHWRSAFIVGGLMLLGGNGTIVCAQRYVPSGLTSLLVATVPLWMVLVQWLGFGGRKPAHGVFLGIAMGLTGVWFLMASNFSHLDAGRIPPGGAMAILAASLSWSVGSVYSHKAPLPRAPILSTAIQMLAGGTLLLCAGLLKGEYELLNIAKFSAKSVAAFIYLILIGSLIGYTAYIWLLKNVGVARTSTYAFVNPAVAVFLGCVFAGETLSPQTLLAGLFIIIAVILITTFHKKSEAITV